MKRNFSYIALIIAVLASIFAVYIFVNIEKSSAPEFTNVILISVDTLRADRLNCYGYDKFVTSPNIDALSRDGILFENCMTNSPWTTPSHMSMLTSLYPSSHGVITSFPELINSLFSNAHYNFNRLKDSTITLAEALKSIGFETAAFTAGGPLDPAIGFGQGFGLYDTSMFKLTDKNMGEMFKWIKINSTRPFFLFWHNFEVHAPYLRTSILEKILPVKASQHMHQVHLKLAEIPNQNTWPEGQSDLMNKHSRILADNKAYTRTICEALYLGGILHADKWLGNLVRLLKDLKIYDNTMIVFTSDHGEEFAERLAGNYYNKHGHTLYEEMIHIPLIIKLPNQDFAGKRINQLTSCIDFMPTITDYFKIDLKIDEMQGKSLMPLVNNDKEIINRMSFSEALAFEYEMKCLRTEKYKTIIYIDEKSVAQKGRNFIPEKKIHTELYDLLMDPYEKDNLLTPEHKGKYLKLARSFIQQIRAQTEAQEGSAEQIKLDQRTIEKLKGLGYIE